MWHVVLLGYFFPLGMSIAVYYLCLIPPPPPTPMLPFWHFQIQKVHPIDACNDEKLASNFEQPKNTGTIAPTTN